MADAKRAALAAVLIAWPLMAWSQYAWAQTPPGDDSPTATEAPRQLPGSAVEQNQLPPPESGSGPPAGSSNVVVAPLGAPEGPAAGLLDSSNGGLGSDIWTGTSREEIDTLLARLPVASPVYSERELARRLLLTTANAPIGAAPHAFLTVRLQALLKAGFVLEAAILAAHSQVADDPEFARAAADAILFAGHADDVCGNATAMRLQNADRFWMELRAYCYAIGGDNAALDLTRSVMAAQNADDKAFDILLSDALSHKAVDPGPIPNPTSLHLFLLRQAGLPVSVGLAKQLGTPALLLAMDDARNPPEDRASAAEIVLRAGALPMAHLIAVANAQTFTPEQLATPKPAAASLPFFLGQALLRQAAALADANNAKAPLVTAALAHGMKADLFEVAAGLQGDIAASVEPQASMPTEAELMSRALLLDGRPDGAARWSAGLNSDPAREAALQIELNLVAPNAARAANAQSALTGLAQHVASKTASEQEQAYAALALGLYDALGEPLSPDATAAALVVANWRGRRPSAETMAHLAAATQQPNRKGEALLLILSAIGADGPGDLAPDVTVGFVRTLAQEGVPDAARLLAIDALLLYKPAPPASAPVAP
ncbi:MAG: hypothetical protein ABSA49_06920 [Rhizomicrobium sp.]